MDGKIYMEGQEIKVKSPIDAIDIGIGLITENRREEGLMIRQSVYFNLLAANFEKYSKKHFINSLDDLLPKALIPIVVSLSGIEAHKAVNAVTKEERAKLVNLLKHFPLTAVGVRPVEEAIVTSGGVKVSEINPSTMESKLVSGLYFAGEVIDIDGYTGGYNLQAAFSTGYLAGINASENMEVQ